MELERINITYEKTIRFIRGEKCDYRQRGGNSSVRKIRASAPVSRGNHRPNGIINSEVFLQLLRPNYVAHFDSLTTKRHALSLGWIYKSCH